MAHFWVDFSASVIVEAKTEEEAKEKFFKEKFFTTKKYHYVEVSDIEEIDESPEKLLDN